MSDKKECCCDEIAKQLTILNSHIEKLIQIQSAGKVVRNEIAAIPPTIHLPTTEPASVKGEQAILAPMPGIIISYEKKIGDTVKMGEAVVVLEAMKMYNNLCAPCDGVIAQTPFVAGDNVRKYDVLCVVDAGQ